MPVAPAFPTPAASWLKWAIRFASWSSPWIEALLEYDGLTAEENIQWRRLQMTFTRTTPAATTEDVAICTFDLINLGSGDIGDWSTSNYTDAEAALATWWTAVRQRVYVSHTLHQYRWYKAGFNPMSSPKPFQVMGAPDRVTSVGLPGTGNGFPQAYQVALSVTEKTSAPKHWGRFYIPGVQADELELVGGRWRDAAVTAIADATATLYTDWDADGLRAVVPMTQLDKVFMRSLMGVTAIQVDDVPDVIRRRRPKIPSFKQVRPLGA